jgi:hypothetical protein
VSGGRSTRPPGSGVLDEVDVFGEVVRSVPTRESGNVRMRKQRRILWVSEVTPYPLYYGSALRTYHTLKHRNHDHHVTFC